MSGAGQTFHYKVGQAPAGTVRRAGRTVGRGAPVLKLAQHGRFAAQLSYIDCSYDNNVSGVNALGRIEVDSCHFYAI